MRFHVPALPGRALTRDNSTCAYTQKVRRFALMMAERGHDVIVYCGPEHDLGEQVEVVEAYRTKTPAAFDPTAWSRPNRDAAAAIRQRTHRGDFLCLIGGLCQQELAALVPDLIAVEFGIGYAGVFAPYRVFESYSWMHSVYAQGQDPMAVDGRWQDAVIPNYFDAADFPAAAGDGDYLLYLGRLAARKGSLAAGELAEAAGMPLVLAGGGEDRPAYGDAIGPVGPDARAELLSGAVALIQPTLYVEPFGGSVAEALLSGVPVITTDWGAFTETVVEGRDGYRIRSVPQFVEATRRVRGLDRARIRAAALARWSIEAVAPQYEAFFTRVVEGYYGGGINPAP